MIGNASFKGTHANGWAIEAGDGGLTTELGGVMSRNRWFKLHACKLKSGLGKWLQEKCDYFGGGVDNALLHDQQHHEINGSSYKPATRRQASECGWKKDDCLSNKSATVERHNQQRPITSGLSYNTINPQNTGERSMIASTTGAASVMTNNASSDHELALPVLTPSVASKVANHLTPLTTRNFTR
ncbi:hypothetical protein AMTR_s00012p00117040 [Amborella trichopoda]|uniref:Uncharacterized protein n=1 Tax=Amborella trichopoda TaxID=13333 RepID=W1PKW9_AMBTC|nr:hypothetical protein AMTR_s00012p00117040 [Amborella trichopoda]